MARGIFLMTEENKLVEMNEREYDSEAILQDILARFPTLLLNENEASDGKELLLIKREMAVPSDIDENPGWSADHLFISHEGIPIIVEVKRKTDTRIRREVVGQMLDYAANGISYWSIEYLQNTFEDNCIKDGVDSHKRMNYFLGIDNTETQFWENVRLNLIDGKIKMVFVADDIPKELKSIILFLNKQMDPAEVIGIEVKQYVDEKGAHKALVPQLIGKPEDTAGRMYESRGFVNEDEFMAEISENAKSLFTSILGLNGQNALKVKWGSSGFSLRSIIGNKIIPICWGFNKNSGKGEIIQIKFSSMSPIKNYSIVVEKYRNLLLNFDFVKPSGNEGVKIIFDKKMTEIHVSQIVKIIKDLAIDIQSNGLA
jgi:hypothetical protein